MKFVTFIWWNLFSWQNDLLLLDKFCSKWFLFESCTKMSDETNSGDTVTRTMNGDTDMEESSEKSR